MAEIDVSIAQYRNLMWDLAIIFGWLSPVVLAMGYYARKRFKALLKAPLTEEVEHQTHAWEHRVRRWTILGLLIPGISIICFIAWFVLSRLSSAA